MKLTRTILPQLLVTAAVLLTGCQTTQDDQSETLSDTTLAAIALESGDTRSAVKLYQQLLEADPANPDILLPLAKAYRALASPQLAEHYLRQIPEPALTAATWREIGLARLDQQHYAPATEAFDKALTLAPRDVASLNGLGVAASWLKQHDRSHDALLQALAMEPGNIRYTNNLALNHILRGQYEPAIRLLYPLYRQQRATAKIRSNLALALALSDREERARQVLASDLSTDDIEQNLRFYRQFAQDKAAPANTGTTTAIGDGRS